MQTTKYVRASMSANDQKLCTEFWLCPLSFRLWLDGINCKFKNHLDQKSKERFYKQKFPKSKCTRKETVDKYILITSRISDWKVTKPIRTTSGSKELLHKNKEFENNLPLHFFTNYWQMSCEQKAWTSI